MSVSAQQLRKIYSRRRVVAINFLSNISLDGAPTKKDVVRQRMSRNVGQTIRINEEANMEILAAGDEQKKDAAEEDAEQNDRVILRHDHSVEQKHMRACTADQATPLPTSAIAHQRATSGQTYVRSISSTDSEQQSCTLTSPNATNLSVKSFISPGTNSVRLQTCVSVDRRSELSTSGNEPMSMISLANAVGSRLKAQLTKLDGDISCSFDALRAFGLVRTTDKKAVISFGSLLQSSVGATTRSTGEMVRHAGSSQRASQLAITFNTNTVTAQRSEANLTNKPSGQQSAPIKSDRNLTIVPNAQPGASTISTSPGNLKNQKQSVLSRSAGLEDGSGGSSVSAPSQSYFPNMFDEIAIQSFSRASRLNASQSELKRMMNEHFKIRFPTLQLSLSKLLSLKRELAQVGRKCSLEPAIIANAFVFFERLLLGALIRKDNRKPCCGACLILSAKLNDVCEEPLRTLIKELEQTFRIARRELLAYEVAILVALEFNLNTQPSLMLPHYQRIVDAYNS